MPSFPKYIYIIRVYSIARCCSIPIVYPKFGLLIPKALPDSSGPPRLAAVIDCQVTQVAERPMGVGINAGILTQMSSCGNLESESGRRDY